MKVGRKSIAVLMKKPKSPREHARVFHEPPDYILSFRTIKWQESKNSSGFTSSIQNLKSCSISVLYCTVLYCAVLIQAGEAGDGVTLDPAPVGAQNVVEELVLLLIIRHQ